MGARCVDEDGWRGARTARYNVSGGGVATRGERWQRPWGPGSGPWGGARGSGYWTLARWCSDSEGRRVGIGGVASGGTPGDRGVPCGEGLGGVGTGDWRGGAQMVRGGTWRRVGIGGVAAQGDQRGGVVLGWCGDWLVVTPEKRNTKSVG
jgi:hypothetical protein